MDEEDKAQSDWTVVENEVVVAEYLAMFQMQLSGLEFVKLHRIQALQDIIRRSRPSIEFKLRNISAALERLSYPWLSGYRPAHNYQGTLMQVLEQNIERFDVLFAPLETVGHSGFAEAPVMVYEAPPQPIVRPELPEGSEIKRLVRKFDPAQRDDRNRRLGLMGEEYVFRSEKHRLSSENPRLVDKVRWISRDDGDGAGYDILSYDKDGRERLLEVKTTVGGSHTPFFITRNEVSLAQEKPDKFRLIRLYDFRQQARAFELLPPLENHVRLEAQNFVAKFRSVPQLQ